MSPQNTRKNDSDKQQAKTCFVRRRTSWMWRLYRSGWCFGYADNIPQRGVQRLIIGNWLYRSLGGSGVVQNPFRRSQ